MAEHLLHHLQVEGLIPLSTLESPTNTCPYKKWEKMNWLPLWTKPKSEILEEDYVNFYLHNIQDNIEQHVKEPPIFYSHFNVEGSVNFTALLYIPTKAPYNLFEPSKRGQSLKLYIKNVLITATQTELYPKWMEFIKGIIDTFDIELNVFNISLNIFF